MRMSMFRGWALAALTLCASMIVTPTVAAASPGVGVIYGSSLTISADRADVTIDPAILVDVRPLRDTADRRSFGRARRDADMTANLMLTRSTAPLATSPLEVGALRAGSVRAQG